MTIRPATKALLTILDGRLPLDKLILKVSMLLTNGGIHSLGNALLQGKKGILIPAQAEQAAIAQQPIVQVATDAASFRREIARLNASAQMPWP